MIQISTRQRGNKLIEYLSRCKVRYSAELCYDYEPTPEIGILFLSLKYHLLYGDYVYRRVEQIREKHKNKAPNRVEVLLLYVDLHARGCEERLSDSALSGMSSLMTDFVGYKFNVLCSYSPAESAKYVESFQTNHGRGAASLQGYGYMVRKKQAELAADTASSILQGLAPTTLVSFMQKAESLDGGEGDAENLLDGAEVLGKQRAKEREKEQEKRERELAAKRILFLTRMFKLTDKNAKDLLAKFKELSSLSQISQKEFLAQKGLGKTKFQTFSRALNHPFLQ